MDASPKAHRTPAPVPKLAYSIREVVEATSLGPTTVFKLIKEGRLRTAKVGTRTLVRAAELDRFMDELFGADRSPAPALDE